MPLPGQRPTRAPPSLADQPSHLLACLVGDAWGQGSGGCRWSADQPLGAQGRRWRLVGNGEESVFQGRGPARELGDKQPYTGSGTTVLNPCLNYQAGPGS